ncbi:MAG: DUF2207 domain-containing protein [Chloroflexia bacterium]|nr:DUF2207 domain-containing protein [Chloroflexia bacterium]
MKMSAIIRMLILLCAFGLLSAPAQAQEEKNLTWRRYDVALDVQSDGRLRVTETQEIEYLSGRWMKGGRKIPLDRVDDISDVEVSLVEEGGGTRSLDAQTYVENGELQIAWQYPSTSGGESRTFQISYVVDGVVRVYSDNQQIRWIAVPDERRFPVEQSTVTLRLPGAVSLQPENLESYPERLRGEERATPNGAVYTVDGLLAGEGFEIRAQMPAGTIAGAQPPEWQAAADRQDRLNETVKPRNNVVLLGLGLLIPVVGLVGLLGLWFTRGKDPGVGRDAESINQPPSDLPAPLAGVLLDEQADVQDVVSTILSLSERGVLRITQEENAELLGSNIDYRMELIQPYQPRDLRAYERTLVDTVFALGDAVRLSEVRGRFMAALPVFRDRLYEEVVRAGLFRANPEHTRKRYRSLGIGVLALGILLGCVGTSVLSAYASPFFLFLPAFGLAAVGVGLMALSRAMPVRTLNGAVEASRWRSFRTYLEHIERTPDIVEDKGAFERYLSYATAFNLGRSWLQKFASVGVPAPAWYGQAGAMDMDEFGTGGGGFGRRRGGLGMGGGPIIFVPPFGGGHGHGGHAGGSVSGGNADGGGLFDFGDQRGVLDQTSGGFGDLLEQASDAFGGADWGGGGGGGFGGGGGGGGADFS